MIIFDHIHYLYNLFISYSASLFISFCSLRYRHGRPARPSRLEPSGLGWNVHGWPSPGDQWLVGGPGPNSY